MKSKEQLAEEYAVSQHLNRFAEEWVEKAFLTGFDARDAQLKELLEFDEEQFTQEFREQINEAVSEDAILGAELYHSRVAKIIAAKDAEFTRLKLSHDKLVNEKFDLMDTLKLAAEKIRELEGIIAAKDEELIGWKHDCQTKDHEIAELKIDHQALKNANEQLGFARQRIDNFEEIKKQHLDKIAEQAQEIERLKKIIAKELSENDELGAEYTYVRLLKEQLTEAVKCLKAIEKEGIVVCSPMAREFLAKFKGEK